MQPRAPPPPPEQCRNCGEALAGRFCSRCGQEAVPDRTFRELVQAFVGELFEVDSRAVRTLRLLLRPGALPVEWREGKRIRYLSPVRLYLVASVLFFSAVALGPNVVHIQTTDAQSDLVEETASPDRARSFEEKLALAAGNEDRLNDLFLQAFAWTMFVLVPVFALLLRRLFRGGNLLYAHHFVFALHYHAFGFLTMVAGLLAAQLPGLGRATVVAAVVAPHGLNAGYLLLAMRRFYGTGWAGTVARAAALGFGYLLALAAGASGTLALLIVALY